MSTSNNTPIFDFSNIRANSNTELETYLSEKKNRLEKKLNNKQTNNKSSNFVWFLMVLVLGLSLGFGMYSFQEIQKNRETIARLEQESGEVAGVSEVATSYNPALVEPLTGYGFSVVPQRDTDLEFTRDRKAQDSAIFSGLRELYTKHTALASDGSQNYEAFIEVSAIEYDNKLNREQFTAEVEKFLGAGYTLETGEVSIPKEYQLNKFSNTTDSSVAYFATVTNDYYYLIKHKNGFRGVESLQAESEYVDLMISWLYIN